MVTLDFRSHVAILDAIIDHLDAGPDRKAGKRALCAMLRVSHFFLERASRPLYRTLDLIRYARPFLPASQSSPVWTSDERRGQSNSAAAAPFDPVATCIAHITVIRCGYGAVSSIIAARRPGPLRLPRVRTFVTTNMVCSSLWKGTIGIPARSHVALRYPEYLEQVDRVLARGWRAACSQSASRLSLALGSDDEPMWGGCLPPERLINLEQLNAVGPHPDCIDLICRPLSSTPDRPFVALVVIDSSMDQAFFLVDFIDKLVALGRTANFGIRLIGWENLVYSKTYEPHPLRSAFIPKQDRSDHDAEEQADSSTEKGTLIEMMTFRDYLDTLEARDIFGEKTCRRMKRDIDTCAAGQQGG